MARTKETVESNVIAKKLWDYNKNEANNLLADKISCQSHKYAYFICSKCNKSWYGIIRDAIRQGKCPECRKIENIQLRRKRRSEVENAVAILHPELVDEWVYEENDKLNLTPYTVSCSSGIKVNWKCGKCGNIYLSSVSNRVKMHSGCPYCSGQKAKAGFNDFASARPDLLKEWDYEVNQDESIFPTDYTCGSKKVVNWICPIGHKYRRSIQARSNGKNCSICGKSNQTSLPEQSVYYYVKKYFQDAVNRYKFNGKKEIDIYIPSMKIGIEYDGIYYHGTKRKKESDERKDEYFASKGIMLYRIKEINNDAERLENEFVIYVRESSTYKYLDEAIVLLLSRLNITNADVDIKRDIINIYSLYMNTIKNDSVAMNSALLKEWDKDKNGDVNPEAVSNNSNIKIWWKCELGHSYQASPKNRNHDTGCPYCAGKMVLKGFNDLETFAQNNNMESLLNEWDYNLNIDRIDEIYFGSSKKYKWICTKCTREYDKSAAARIHGVGCPYCNHKKVDKELSFGYLHPELLIDWNYELNEISPYEVAEFSNKYAFWKCHVCGNEMKATINSRAKGFRCNVCSIDKTRQASHETRVNKRGSLQEKRPLLILDWDFEKNELGNIFPDKVTCGSGIKVWWKCNKCGHNWEDTINVRNKGKMCPKCRYTPYPKPRKEVSDEQKRNHQRKVQENAAKTRVKERGSLRDNRPLLMQDWDFEKNSLLNITPDDITIGSKIVVWWKCSECNHRWKDMVQSRSYGKRCPSCRYTHYPKVRRRGGNS